MVWIFNPAFFCSGVFSVRYGLYGAHGSLDGSCKEVLQSLGEVKGLLKSLWNFHIPSENSGNPTDRKYAYQFMIKK